VFVLSNELLETIAIMPEAKEELLNILRGAEDVAYENQEIDVILEIEDLIERIENLEN